MKNSILWAIAYLIVGPLSIIGDRLASLIFTWWPGRENYTISIIGITLILLGIAFLIMALKENVDYRYALLAEKLEQRK